MSILALSWRRTRLLLVRPLTSVSREGSGTHHSPTSTRPATRGVLISVTLSRHGGDEGTGGLGPKARMLRARAQLGEGLVCASARPGEYCSYPESTHGDKPFDLNSADMAWFPTANGICSDPCLTATSALKSNASAGPEVACILRHWSILCSDLIRRGHSSFGLHHALASLASPCSCASFCISSCTAQSF